MIAMCCLNCVCILCTIKLQAIYWCIKSDDMSAAHTAELSSLATVVIWTLLCATLLPHSTVWLQATHPKLQSACSWMSITRLYGKQYVLPAQHNHPFEPAEALLIILKHVYMLVYSRIVFPVVLLFCRHFLETFRRLNSAASADSVKGSMHVHMVHILIIACRLVV